MSQSDEWSPDEPSGSDPFEQGDEAFDDSSALDPSFIEAVELDPSLDPALQVDNRELEEAGAVLDDPDGLAVLDGGIDDPDGIGEPTPRERARAADDEGWDLDAPEVPGSAEEEPEGG
ncbi:MAG: hypothetical protein ACLQPH_19830 [Acidimicrobiales bacterium]